MSKKMQLARDFAHAAHDSIQHHRKYTNEPYWVHTDEVATIVLSDNLAMRETEDMVCAAHLHDVIEDVFPINNYYNIYRIDETFGKSVADLVVSLTDVYTKEAYPDLNRKQRKALELKRIALTSPEAKTIKLADLISNTQSIVKHDKDFARVYLREKMEMLGFLADGSPRLLQIASNIALAGYQELGLSIPKFTA